jgi:uncharacterized protein involved in exopolysaccharide biosynthesis
LSFFEFVAALRRRWYAVVAAFALTAAAGWHVEQQRPVYQATAVVLVVPPAQPYAPNSVAALTPSIAATGQLVDQELSDSSAAAQLRRAGVAGDFAVTPRNSGTSEMPRYTLPSEQLSVIADAPGPALSSLTALMSAFRDKLRDLQARAGVGARNQLTAQVLVSPGVVPVHGSRSRGLVGVAVLGMGGAAVLPLWCDRYARGRARRGRAPTTRERSLA